MDSRLENSRVGVDVDESAPRTVKCAVVEHAGHTAYVHVCLHQAAIDLPFDEEHVVVIGVGQRDSEPCCRSGAVDCSSGRHGVGEAEYTGKVPSARRGLVRIHRLLTTNGEPLVKGGGPALA